jgi:hypothetical protein
MYGITLVNVVNPAGDKFHLIHVIPEPDTLHPWPGIYIPPDDAQEREEVGCHRKAVAPCFKAVAFSLVPWQPCAPVLSEGRTNYMNPWGTSHHLSTCFLLATLHVGAVQASAVNGALRLCAAAASSPGESLGVGAGRQAKGAGRRHPGGRRGQGMGRMQIIKVDACRDTTMLFTTSSPTHKTLCRRHLTSPHLHCIHCDPVHRAPSLTKPQQLTTTTHPARCPRMST